MKTFILIMSALGIMLSTTSEAKIVPSDGLWQTYDDPAIGSGVNIRTQGDITMVTVFTYREDGSPVWYYATGEIDEVYLYDIDKLQQLASEARESRVQQVRICEQMIQEEIQL